MELPASPAWTWVDTPLGEALIVTSRAGVCRTVFAPPQEAWEGSPNQVLPADFARALDEVTGLFGEPPIRDDVALKPVRDQVEQWFSGQRQEFDVAVDLTGVRGFRRDLYRVIQEIPYGETASYGEVAALAGSPLAARAAGTACRDVPVSLFLPVHRVTRANGSTGESPNSPCHRRNLLQHEAAVLGRGASPWN
ncbi:MULTISPECIES: methylated-DNA--[protein]-cysteine S-methyltransferase [Kocuria]|uniref:Methylated-DNA--[protein]-cysteine S-methyltransferase n=1 Tax=Kocuria subflava TaxID=1736139 RepID=A0A846TRQ6_9MICC|nr:MULTISPECIES: methylated-DNA--[protein]-cysteine S-methyltransferase [Kocuria]NKE08412.1 methylated-DNA--[protein]-cysteine S-methyltransferase [Kocuria subflava]